MLPRKVGRNTAADQHRFQVDFTAHMPEGTKEMYMFVTANDRDSAAEQVKEAVPYPITVNSVEPVEEGASSHYDKNDE